MIDKKELELKFYKHSTSANNRGVVICNPLNKGVCSCYKHEYPEVKRKFFKEYNGNNFNEISLKLKEEYNLKIKGKKN